jgi:hypothetical protein
MARKKNRGPGRPALPANQRRNKYIRLCLTVEEIAAIRRSAKAKSLEPGVWAREQILRRAG